MPSPQSVPPCPGESRWWLQNFGRRVRIPAGAAASISSGIARMEMEIESVDVSSLACRAAASASRYRLRPLWPMAAIHCA